MSWRVACWQRFSASAHALARPHHAAESCGLQGQQAFISYGQQSNDRLLQYYGFVEQRNPADTYVMTSMPQRLEVRGLP